MIALLLLLMTVGCDSLFGEPSEGPSGGSSTPPPASRPLVCEQETPPAGAWLLAFSTHGTHGAEFAEWLRVDCAGKIELQATVPFTSSRVGRFAAQLDEAELRNAVSVARQLTLPAPTPSLPPQGADTSVTVSAVPDPVSAALRPETGPGHGEAARLHARYVARAIASPVAALAVTVTEPPNPTGALMIRVANPGREAVSELHVESVRISDAAGRVWFESGEGSPPAFFADRLTNLGLEHGAALAAGASGVAVVTVDRPGPGRHEVRATLTGTVRFVDAPDGEWIPPADFQLTSEPATVGPAQ